MKTEGRIKQIGDTFQVTDKFKKRELLLEKDLESKYPQTVQFQLSQDKCSLVDNYRVGDIVEVSFNLMGREYVKNDGTKTAFNTLDVWKIELKRNG